MYKIAFVCVDFGRDLGTNMHYKALCEAYGKENVMVYDFYPGEPSRKENMISYGKYRNAADRMLRWAQGNTMYISSAIIREICAMIRENGAEVVFIERPLFAGLVKKVKKSCPGVKVVTFYHDINAILYPQWIQTEKRKRDVIEYQIGIRQERITADKSDVNLVLNRRDADLFSQIYGKQPEGIVHLSAPVEKIPEAVKTAVTPPEREKKVLFVGAYYMPNLIGLDWFCENVLPRITAPIRFDVVGRGLERLRGKYHDSRVHMIGGVEDLGAYYADADIVIAPLFDGGGMKQKTVEALSYGKIFVGTTESLFGYREEMDDSVMGKTAFECNTADEWVETLNRLAGGEIKKFNEALYELFIREFSYEAQRDVLLQYI